MAGTGGERTEEIQGQSALTETEAAQVHELIALCNDAERLDLKVDIEGLREGGGGDAHNVFLAHHGSMLAGFCTLDGGREIELCGAVHPVWRRRGIGSALLEAARAECQRRGATKLLLICEDGSESGQGFVATLHGRREFAEHRLERDTRTAGMPEVTGSVTLRLATTDDLPAMAHITALAFGRHEPDEWQRFAGDMGNPAERFFLAERDGVSVGTLKLFIAPPRALIYGFAVLPEQQGKGYGRESLNQAIRLLAGEGWMRVGLEVETENTPAYTLYTSTGFQHVTTYGYFALPL